MSAAFEISFARTAKISGGLVVALKAADGDSVAAEAVVDPAGTLPRAIKIAKYNARFGAVLDLVAPQGSPADRLIVTGLGKSTEMIGHEWVKAGGTIVARVQGADTVTIFTDVPGMKIDGDQIADFALGMVLRCYDFDRYKTTRKNNDEEQAKSRKPARVTIVSASAASAKKAYESRSSLAEGVFLARDLVNEPPNILGPEEFAARALTLDRLGVDIEILTEKEMTRLGMGAILGVAQGSARGARMVVMQWKGGRAKDKPLAFIGKGVVFDSGGISLKPGSGMEEMKGDMGGAAAVAGLMHALASRKARANVVGIIGLVENMPDGNAQRPGDIVTSMSGQTIEIINTDAEGRLVLGDALWYCNDRFAPQLMVNLATLTGAVGVALGGFHAGLFSNQDILAENLLQAGLTTNEKLWRMPLGKEYDKLIDSRFADMKNTGGRQAGSITAAQFLKRFVGETPWAHLDIASTAMSAPSDEINTSWASGFGVRLLDEFVRTFHES